MLKNIFKKTGRIILLLILISAIFSIESVFVEIAVDERFVQSKLAIEAIIRGARIEKISVGKIFVAGLLVDVIRIRAGEKGKKAIG